MTAILGLILLAGTVSAGNRVAATAITLPLSVRQMGMGNVSVGGNDTLRAWANPSLLADQVTTVEVAVNAASMFGEQTAGGLGLGWKPRNNIGVGILVSYNTIGAKEIDIYGDEVAGELSHDTTAVGIVGAYRIGIVRVGLGIKSVSEKLVTESASAIAADIGASATFETGGGVAGVGVAMRNIGQDMYESAGTGITAALPTEFRAGVSYRLLSPNLGAGIEYVMPSALDPSLGLGVEWWPAGFLAVRAGVYGLGGDDDPRITFGLSGIYRGISIDYGAGTHVLGLTNRVSLSYAFGGQPAAASSAAPKVQKDIATKPEPARAPVDPDKMLNFAVADLEAQNVSAGDAAVIADLLRTELVKSKQFNVVEKKNMDRLLSEQAFQQTGCTTEDCAVKLGKLLNVQRMAMGSFGKLLENYYINIRVIDVETGRIVFSESYRGQTGIDIEKGIKQIARKIVKEAR